MKGENEVGIFRRSLCTDQQLEKDIQLDVLCRSVTDSSECLRTKFIGRLDETSDIDIQFRSKGEKKKTLEGGAIK